MLKTLKGFLAGALVTATFLAWFGYTKLVIRTEDGLRLVPKIQGSFDKLYVDVRAWGPVDYVRNSDVSEAMARHGLATAADALSGAVEDAKERASKAAAEVKQRLEKQQ